MTATVNGHRRSEPPPDLLPFDPEAPAEAVVVEAEPIEPRTNPLATVANDLRTSWAAIAEPPTLTDWLAGPTTSLDRIPDDNALLRGAWTVDNWITGVFFLAVSIVAFGLGAIARWLACHPARRWSALLLGVATSTYLWLA